jgi:hypothetical protein
MFALPAAAALGLAMLAGSAAATDSRPHARIVTLTIRAIDQAGHPEQLVTGWYISYRLGDQGTLISGANKLVVARYAVAVEVPTLDPHGTDIANTLIARNLNVQHNMTLTLSARHSVPVQVSLDGAQLDDVIGNVCAITGIGSPGRDVMLREAAQGPLYIVPYQSKLLRFVYQATSTAPGGTEYNLAGSFAGLPAKPVASFTKAGLARVSLRVTDGAVRPWSGHAGLLSFSPGGLACGATDSGPSQSVLDPSVTTEYFSPGTWQPAYLPINTRSGSGSDTLTETYAAGRSYSDTFYGPAWGPYFFTPTTFTPATYGERGPLGIQTWVSDLFDDPAGTSDPDARAVVSLALHRRTLYRLHLRNLDGYLFRDVVHHSGWYTLAIAATRRPANGFILPSPRVTIRWRFYASLALPGLQLPLSNTRYSVGGLNLHNQAAPGARTTIAVFVVDLTDTWNVRRAWREVRVQVSFNGGGTWQTLRLNRRGRDWTVAFREPPAGTVSLRSTVVSPSGDSTVQTIYDAYNIQ